MADEDLKTAIDALMEQIIARPDERPALVRRMREKIADMRARGLPIPPEFRQFEDELPQGDPDEFDNMPV